MDNYEIKCLTQRLRQELRRLNIERFNGEIRDYSVRFSRGSVRTHGSINFDRKQIRISLQMYEQYGWDAVVTTLLHEMTHALIHQRGGHNRHTKRFWDEFRRRGGVRDKIDVRPKSVYIYACPTCGVEIERVRKMSNPSKYSCIRCDKKYNPQHRLYLKGDKNLHPGGGVRHESVRVRELLRNSPYLS